MMSATLNLVMEPLSRRSYFILLPAYGTIQVDFYFSLILFYFCFPYILFCGIITPSRLCNCDMKQ